MDRSTKNFDQREIEIETHQTRKPSRGMKILLNFIGLLAINGVMIPMIYLIPDAKELIGIENTVSMAIFSSIITSGAIAILSMGNPRWAAAIVALFVAFKRGGDPVRMASGAILAWFVILTVTTWTQNLHACLLDRKHAAVAVDHPSSNA